MAAGTLLSGTMSFPTGFTVPAGDVWELDPNTDTTITVGGNIVVHGTLKARPNPGVTHRIRFVGINEANIVGGHTLTPITSDIGIWIDGGIADIKGTTRTPWNRTGVDSSWQTGDELRATSMLAGEYHSTPYTSGSPILTTTTQTATNQGSKTYIGEVVNLTRNVIIESVDGRAHIMFINCTERQTLAFTELRRLGPTGKSGRYPLHAHMNGDGMEGSDMRGNVARNCGNHAFVPHMSHGIDMTGCIAVDTQDDAFWWDQDADTHRTRWDKCVAIGTKDGPGFRLGNGRGNTCTESVAVGTDANSSNAGFLWPSDANHGLNVWEVSGSVAHNNKTHGFRVWQNDQSDHHIDRCVAYRNTGAGFDHGAYRNRYRYTYCVSFQNTGRDTNVHAVGHIIFRNCWIERLGIDGHSVSVEKTEEVLFEMDRYWKIFEVRVDEASNNNAVGRYRFESGYRFNDLAPSDFTIISQLSPIVVDNKVSSDFVLTP